MTNHFSEHVTEATKAKMLEVAEAFKDEFISSFPEAFGFDRLDVIHGKHISGFIPFTGGGYQVSEYYNGYGSGRYFTKEEQDFMQGIENDAYRQWLSDNDLTDDDALTEDQQTALWDYINEWLQDCDSLLSVEIWTGHRDDPEPDSVTIRVSLNYKDAPYYREKYAVTLWETILDNAEFLQVDTNELIEQAKTGVNSHA